MWVRGGVVLELDFNRLSEVSWPALKSLADSGIKVVCEGNSYSFRVQKGSLPLVGYCFQVFPLDRRTDSFVGVAANGSIFTNHRGERRFADFWFSRSFNDVILTQCRRILRFTSGALPLEPLVESKIPKDEVSRLHLFSDPMRLCALFSTVLTVGVGSQSAGCD